MRYNAISADPHIVEPADLWQSRMPSTLLDRAPVVRRSESGLDIFYCDGRSLLAPSMMSRAGKPRAEWGYTMEDADPGASDPTINQFGVYSVTGTVDGSPFSSSVNLQ
jgi:hypothetical protein